MELNLSKDLNVAFNLIKKFKKYSLETRVKSKYFNYSIVSRIDYEDIISIIENIENMLFAKYRQLEEIDLFNIIFEFDEFETSIKLVLKIDYNQEYSVTLNRVNVIKLYNYLTQILNTVNKVKMLDFNRKFTYVEVRYIDVYSSTRYSYISDDRSIKVGDIVYVDRAGTKCLAVVESKNDYYYEDAPYPVLETKRVIKIVTRVGNYKK